MRDSLCITSFSLICVSILMQMHVTDATNPQGYKTHFRLQQQLAPAQTRVIYDSKKAETETPKETDATAHNDVPTKPALTVELDWAKDGDGNSRKAELVKNINKIQKPDTTLGNDTQIEPSQTNSETTGGAPSDSGYMYPKIVKTFNNQNQDVTEGNDNPQEPKVPHSDHDDATPNPVVKKKKPCKKCAGKKKKPCKKGKKCAGEKSGDDVTVSDNTTVPPDQTPAPDAKSTRTPIMIKSVNSTDDKNTDLDDAHSMKVIPQIVDDIDADRQGDGSVAPTGTVPRGVFVNVDGSWQEKKPEDYIIVISIGLASETANGATFSKLRKNKVVVTVPNHWVKGEPPDIDCQNYSFDIQGKDADTDLCTLANRVQEIIVKKGPPSVVICGSRSSDYTCPSIYTNYWRGPVIMLNGKPNKSPIPKGVIPYFITAGKDNWNTRKFKYVKESATGISFNDIHLPNEEHSILLGNYPNLLEEVVDAAIAHRAPNVQQFQNVKLRQSSGPSPGSLSNDSNSSFDPSFGCGNQPSPLNIEDKCVPILATDVTSRKVSAEYIAHFNYAKNMLHKFSKKNVESVYYCRYKTVENNFNKKRKELEKKHLSTKELCGWHGTYKKETEFAIMKVGFLIPKTQQGIDRFGRAVYMSVKPRIPMQISKSNSIILTKMLEGHSTSKYHKGIENTYDTWGSGKKNDEKYYVMASSSELVLPEYIVEYSD